MGILREADQRVKRYLRAREKKVFIECIVEEICGKNGVVELGWDNCDWGARGRRFHESGVR